MSSRVEQENAARQAEAERLQKRVDRESRDAKAGEAGRDAFAKLVRGQEGRQEAQAKGQKAHAEAKQGEAQANRGAQETAQGERAARMARGGIIQQAKVQEQARSFGSLLTNQQASTHEADQALVQRRDVGQQKDRVEGEERTTDVERKEVQKEGEAEVSRLEARAEAAAGGAVDPDGERKGGRERKDEGGGAPAVAGAAPTAPTQGPQAAREVKQIPPELLEKLVSAVHLAVNSKGLREFQIELKDGPLKGALMKITAEGGKVALRFENLGADEKRLVEASKGELMRRLEKKGLSLSRLDVK